MAGLVRATESYYAGNHLVRAGEMLAEGDPRIVQQYVEVVQLPEAPPPPEPKAKGKAPKEQ